MTNGKLEAALKLAKHFRVFPIIPNGKKPAIKKFPELASQDPAQIAKWWSQEPDFNIGISTDDLLAVDVDMKDGKDGFKSIDAFSREGKFFAPTAQQYTPTGGAHIIYRTPHPIKNSVCRLGDGLDVRGRGGYLVGAGSTVNGKFYGINAVEPIPAPEWLLERCDFAPIKREGAQREAVAVDPERALKRASEYLANLDDISSGERNQAAYRTAAKLKDIGLPEGETFFLMMNEWKCEPMLEAEELKHVVGSAYIYGETQQGADSVESFFPAAETVEEQELGNPIDEFNKSYAFVTSGGGHTIIRETTDEDGNFILERLKEESFHRRYAARTIQVGGKVMAFTRHWMAHPNRRSYEAVVFAPGHDVPKRFYNLWRGFAVKPLGKDEVITPQMRKGVDMFKEHLLLNICSGNLEHYKWVYSWFAHIVQKPGEKPETALVLRGKKGIGKNVLVDCITQFMPTNCTLASDSRYLTGNFNAHLERTQILILDEAFWSGDKQAGGILKDLITGKTTNIERKGVDSYTIKSRLRLIILGNEDWLVPASEEERRYAVFNVGEDRRGDTKFFGELVEAMAKGADRLLFTEFLNADLSGVNLRLPPQTDGLRDQKENSLPPFKQWWIDSLHRGYIEGVDFNGDWEMRIDHSRFKEAFRKYAQERNMRTWVMSDSQVAQALRIICPEATVGKVSGHKLIQVVVPPLLTCRNLWDAHMGHKTEWRD